MATDCAGPKSDDEEFRTLLATFMEETVNRPSARHHLRRVLQGLPRNIRSTSSLLPIDDMELRIEYINRIEEFWRGNFEMLTQQDSTKFKRFFDVQFAALYLMDFQKLKMYATGQTDDFMLFGLLRQLQGIPSLTKLGKSLYNSRSNVIY